MSAEHPWRDVDTLEYLYEKKLMSTCEIGERLDTSRSVIRRWMDRHGMERRSRSESQKLRYEKPDSPKYDADELSRLYHDRGLSQLDIAEKFGVSGAAISKAMKDRGIETRGRGASKSKFADRNYGPDWREQRTERLEKDGFECVVCKMPNAKHREEFGRGLDVHHIRPLRSFGGADGIDYQKANALDNLISLCRDCHEKWEGVPLRPVPAKPPEPTVRKSHDPPDHPHGTFERGAREAHSAE